MLSWPVQTGGGGIVSSGGSAFLVRTTAGILGITAGHVLDGFLVARRARKDITATLGGLAFDLEKRLIQRGNSVDIATFRVDEGLGIKWRVAGVIAEGKPDYDYIVATRADVIHDDGHITG
jgi:hypothetical protein